MQHSTEYRVLPCEYMFVSTTRKPLPFGFTSLFFFETVGVFQQSQHICDISHRAPDIPPSHRFGKAIGSARNFGSDPHPAGTAASPHPPAPSEVGISLGIVDEWWI